MLTAPAFELALPGALDRLRVERLGRGAVPQVVVRIAGRHLAEEMEDECWEFAPVPSLQQQTLHFERPRAAVEEHDAGSCVEAERLQDHVRLEARGDAVQRRDWRVETGRRRTDVVVRLQVPEEDAPRRVEDLLLHLLQEDAYSRIEGCLFFREASNSVPEVARQARSFLR